MNETEEHDDTEKKDVLHVEIFDSARPVVPNNLKVWREEWSSCEWQNTETETEGTD